MPPSIDRRALLAGVAAAGILAPVQASALVRTPRQTEGPFFPDRMPPDIDADLLRIPGRRPYTKGQVAHVRGRVLDRRGRPRAGVKVEIWQCDANGVYRHTGDNRDGRRVDRDFQGYGHVVTGADGRYAFRTIKPVEYPGRTPHIHFKLSRGGRHLLTTQMYVAGDPGNIGDSLYNYLSASQKRAVTVAFKPAGAVEKGALLGVFDIVL